LHKLHYHNDREPKSSLALEEFSLFAVLKRGFLLFTEVNYEGKTEICQVNNNQPRHLEIRLPRAGLRGVLAVILSAAKDLSVRRARTFAALRVTGILSKGLDSSPVC